MTNDLVASKIELLQEQIDNLEKSGYFTELEMDTLSRSYRIELAVLNAAVGMSSFADSIATAANSLVQFALNPINTQHYGMSDEDYEAGRKRHISLFERINAFEVIDAEILTPNHQEA